MSQCIILEPGINVTHQEYFTFNRLTNEYSATISIPHDHVD